MILGKTEEMLQIYDLFDSLNDSEKNAVITKLQNKNKNLIKESHDLSSVTSNNTDKCPYCGK